MIVYRYYVFGCRGYNVFIEQFAHTQDTTWACPVHPSSQKTPTEMQEEEEIQEEIVEAKLWLWKKVLTSVSCGKFVLKDENTQKNAYYIQT